MDLSTVGAGENPPEDVNVIIEIPAHAAPVKYELHKGSGLLAVDRFLSTSMVYPANYGMIPCTLCDDGDPLDVLVVTPLPLVHGCIIRARPVDLLEMTDEKGGDAKIIAVPVAAIYPGLSDVTSIDELPGDLRRQTEHFFGQYKVFEPGKWVEINGWAGRERARAEIMESIEHYQRDHG